MAHIAVELTEKSILVLGNPIGEVRYEVLNLFPVGFAEGANPAEVDGIGLDEHRIQPVLADKLTEAIANPGTAVASVLSIG
jgi:hypothetical protein